MVECALSAMSNSRYKEAVSGYRYTHCWFQFVQAIQRHYLCTSPRTINCAKNTLVVCACPACIYTNKWALMHAYVKHWLTTDQILLIWWLDTGFCKDRFISERFACEWKLVLPHWQSLNAHKQPVASRSTKKRPSEFPQLFDCITHCMQDAFCID